MNTAWLGHVVWPGSGVRGGSGDVVGGGGAPVVRARSVVGG